MRDLDFVDDGAGWRVRRDRELAARQLERDRRYYEEMFGAGTLRLIRIVMIPVWLAVICFTLVLSVCMVGFVGSQMGFWP